jgi:hypothetical protein
LNGGQLLDHNRITVPGYCHRRVQSRSSKARRFVNERCRYNASQGGDAIMLQNNQERILTAPGGIEIFNDVELSRQSKHPHTVRKQAMHFDHLVVGVDRIFVVFVPLARGLLAL